MKRKKPKIVARMVLINGVGAPEVRSSDHPEIGKGFIGWNQLFLALSDGYIIELRPVEKHGETNLD